ncbi:MAG: hypothetical protein VKP63_08590 [Cyanobacteriota bacterium]|nr:hypothetical protein [Cyanobacteriota bacterium]
MTCLPPAPGSPEAIPRPPGTHRREPFACEGCREAPGRRRLPWQPLLLGVLLIASGAPLPGSSEPKRYDPDPDTCQEEVIRRAYKANLLPWEDQPAVVQERLRQLQAAMTLDTLRNCEARGFLSPARVAALTAELQLRAPSTGPSVTPTATPAPSPTRP